MKVQSHFTEQKIPDFLQVIFAELWTLFVRDIFVEWPSVSLNTCRPEMMNEAKLRHFQPIRGQRSGTLTNKRPGPDASYRWSVCRVMSGPALAVINYGDRVRKPIWNVSSVITQIIKRDMAFDPDIGFIILFDVDDKFLTSALNRMCLNLPQRADHTHH